MHNEVIIEVQHPLTGRGACERSAELYLKEVFDYYQRSQRVPFWKPIAQYSSEYPRGDWRGMIEFMVEENRKFLDAIQQKMVCKKHNAQFIKREHNFTDTYGCIYYLNVARKCHSGFTNYRDGVFESMAMFDKSLTSTTRDNLIDFVRKYGAKGCPDYIAFKESILYFIEVKALDEPISDEQLRYFDWCNGNGGIAIIMRVISGAYRENIRRNSSK